MIFDKAVDILHTAKKLGVVIALQDDQLQVKVPKGIDLGQALLEDIRENRQLLIEFLQNDQWRSKEAVALSVQAGERNQKAIALSFNQERLWFIDQLEGSRQYHITSVLRLKGTVNQDGLEYAFQSIVNRHEVLRTVIKQQEGRAWQHVMDKDQWKINYTEFRYENGATPDLLIEQLADRPFNLAEDHMLRVDLVRLPQLENECVLLVTMHHIASDAWSREIVLREFAELYQAYEQKRTPVLEPLKARYGDYAIWQQDYLKGEMFGEKLQYWKRKLEGVPMLELPVDFTRPAQKSIQGAMITGTIPASLSKDLRRLSRKEGVTLFMTLLSAFNILLYKYTGQTDICVGTPMTGRQQEEWEGLIGLFINTLALRNQVNAGMTFSELLQQVAGNTLQDYTHQDVPFEKVVEAVKIERSSSYNPLYQVLFSFQSNPMPEQLSLSGVEYVQEPFTKNAAQLDIVFNVIESAEDISIQVVYCCDLYEPATITRMVAHYEQLLKSVVASPDMTIEKLRMVTEEEETQLLQSFNPSPVAFTGKTVLDLFHEQVLLAPESTALVYGAERLSYGELEVRSNQLAHLLRDRGVGPEVLVPLCVERGVEQVIGILGIWKAGGAYVPLDPALPAERLRYLVADTGASLLVTTSSYVELLAAPEKVILLDEEELYSNVPVTKPANEVQSQQLSYVLYTSGSTGRPKGVLIEHASLHNYLENARRRYVEEGRGSYLHLPFSFDASLTSLLVPLISGGKVVLSRLGGTESFEDDIFLSEGGYDFLKLTPAHLPLLEIVQQAGLTGRLVIGGEALHWEQLDYLWRLGLDVEVVNEYGPTEATVGCIVYSLRTSGTRNSGSVLIGRPLDNVEIYILNNTGGLSGIGVWGEICIGGVQLARGYHNAPELTAEKFIPHPWKAGHRLYRTGDIGRWLSTGEIEYRGRQDDQVKIRGYRVEPGEVEIVLQESPGVKQAAVVAQLTGQRNYQLLGYVVAGGEYDAQEVQHYLRERLPEYMLPALLQEVPELPLTINGKIDRRALLQLSAVASQEKKNHEGPRNETEARLVAIWQELLEEEHIGIHDDFFSLGGHSLLAVRVISMIRKELGREVSIKEVFDHPTISQLSERIREGDAVILPGITARQERPERIPLSFSQERLWFIDRFQGTLQYHIPYVLRLKGNLDKDVLEKAFKIIIDRHEILRTVIKDQAGISYQEIRESSRWELEKITVPEKTRDINNFLHNHINSFLTRPFDIAHDYMLRVCLLRQSATEHLLVVVLHHIASDGWSVGVLIRELSALYGSLLEGKPASLAPLPLQYADYAIWQRQYLSGDSLGGSLLYWKQKLAGVAPLELPLDYTRPSEQSVRGGMVKGMVPAAVYTALQQLSRQKGLSLFMTMLGVFKILLYRYSGQPDISVGVPVAGRYEEGLESLIGFFVNTVVLRSKLEGSMSLEDLLEEVRSGTLEAYEHQEVPFEKIVEVLGVERDRSRNPLFQVMFSLEHASENGELRLGDVAISEEPFEQLTSQFDLSVQVTESGGSLQLAFTYCSDLYKEETVRRMVDHYLVLLQSAVGDTTEKIGRLRMLSEAEEYRLVRGFNDTAVSYPDKTVITLFAEQVKLRGDAPAVVFRDQTISYRELDERSNQLAHYLRGMGVKGEMLIPICVERSVEMITGVLGIMKAGGAYVPLDPDYPQERLHYMLRDIGAKIAVTTGNCAVVLPASLPQVLLDDDWDYIAEEPVTAPDMSATLDQVCYMIYTSGSTGRPKGVKVAHRNLANIAMSWKRDYRLESFEVCLLQMATMAFDVFIGDVCRVFLNGGKMIIAPGELRMDIEGLYKLIRQHKVNIFESTPALIIPLMDYVYSQQLDLSFMELLIIGSDVCRMEDFRRLLQRFGGQMRIVNSYGTTETTIDSSFYESPLAQLQAVATVPIGKPMANTSFYILDASFQVLPVGVPGELYIGGHGVSIGYQNQAGLTSERFVENPFVPGSRMYRTGDTAYWTADGNVAFLGRNDHQAKIRGYRIELGEVEQAIEKTRLVKKVVVVVQDDDRGNKQLIGYIVPEESYNNDKVMESLRAELPDYMVPLLLVALEEIPLTNNGKLNKLALPAADFSNLSRNEYVAPRDPVESAIADIWNDLLGIKQIGVYDNFFDLGGHSVLVMRVISLVRSTLHTEVPIKIFFRHPTIAGLASWITETSGTGSITAIARKEHQGRIPLSFAQDRLWFIDKLQGSVQYHMWNLFRIRGSLDKTVLEEVIQYIVDRHEILRTVIREDNGETYQFIRGKGSWKLDYLEDESLADRTWLMQYIDAQLHKPFNLSEDEMLRITLVKVAEEEYILLTVMHHIVSDAWSLSVLVRELLEVYLARLASREPDLAELSIQYGDYALWQRLHLNKDRLSEQLAYWRSYLQDIEPLQLPTDFVRPMVQSTKGKAIGQVIDSALADKLRALARQEDVTLFMLMLSVFNVMLNKYTGQTDICIGTSIAGRRQQELENLIGFFVNSLTLRNKLDLDSVFTVFLQQVKANLLEVYTCQDVPFEKVVESVVGKRDVAGNPLFQVMFVLENTPALPSLILPGLELEYEAHEHISSIFDLTFSISESEEGLWLRIEYCNDLFRDDTIRQMLEHYLTLLRSATDNPYEIVRNLEMLGEEEKEKLVNHFNNTYVFHQDQTFLDLFHDQVLLAPESTALVYGVQRLSYGELEARSNQLAHLLRDRGVGREVLVPLCVERSMEQVIGILGIWKAGGAYVPLDPALPAERLRYLVADTGASLLVTTSSYVELLTAPEKVILLDEEELYSNAPITKPANEVQSQQLSYVLYTSGSTGRPKGVLIEHASLHNYLENARRRYVEEGRGSYLHLPFSFDASLTSLLVPLISGGKVVLSRLGGTESFEDDTFLSEGGYDFLKLTPAHLPLLEIVQQAGLTGRLVIGGEALHWEQLDYLWRLGLDVEVVNEYGPTEATVGCIVYSLRTSGARNSGSVPIGRPLDNVEIYILNNTGGLSGIGVWGEICIGGVQLARGYHNAPELTAEKFIPHPWKAGHRLYRTGDIGRWLSTGEIEYRGRQDDQVKIRGYRVEPGEVEAALVSLEGVAGGCIVTGEEPGGNKKLTGYYVPSAALVRQRESTLYEQQLQGWQELYETTYSSSDMETEPAEFNITGWTDSFTGGSIAVSQMREWLDDIIRVIGYGHPQSVLEIGCGTGLLYYRLATTIKSYIGTDFSAQTISRLAANIAKREPQTHCATKLLVGAAHTIQLDQEEVIDTIIVNSVIQYFPGEDYLDRVIGQCIGQLRSGGRIVLGDIRDLRLLRLFRGRLLLNRTVDNTKVGVFEWELDQELVKEEELCITPAYFYGLRSRYAQIRHVDIEWKQGLSDNELNLYRYTVVLHIGEAPPLLVVNWLPWSGVPSMERAREGMDAGTGVIGLRGVPNNRLWREALLQEGLEKDVYGTVGELRRLLQTAGEETLAVGAFLSEAADRGYNCRYLVGADPLQMQLVLLKEEWKGGIQNEEQEETKETNLQPNNQSNPQTNIPLWGDITAGLQLEMVDGLKRLLPVYMVPGSLVALSRLPVTVNGKTDRGLLKSWQNGGEWVRSRYEAPVGNLETSLGRIWSSLLGREGIGRQDNFFELGGHSLLATRVVSAIRKELEIGISVRDLFLHPTLESLAVYITRSGSVNLLPPIVRRKEEDRVPLSYAQERLWFIDKLQGSVQYHVPYVLRLRGKLEVGALQQAFRAIVDRHEVLRTIIREEDGISYQQVMNSEGWQLEYRSIGEEGIAAGYGQSYIRSFIARPFDLSRDYMLRVTVVKLSEEEHLVTGVIHHIASDGWSVGILAMELTALYKHIQGGWPLTLPPLPVQYTDYAGWQRQYIAGKLLDEKLQYWQRKLAGAESLELPADYVRPAEQSIRGTTVKGQVGREVHEALQQLSQRQGVTLFMTLLSAFKVLLYRYSGQQDISVGVPVAGRQHQELEGLIGFFVNTLVLRSELSGSETFAELLRSVKQTTLEAYDHQDVPFEKVVEALGVQRDMSRNPLFQVMFALQNAPDNGPLELGGLILTEEPQEVVTSQFDISVQVVESEEGISINMVYCCDLYKPATMIRMVAHYEQLLRSVIINVDKTVGELALLTKQEEAELEVFSGSTATAALITEDGQGPQSILEVFSRQVLQIPLSIAVASGRRQLSYGALEEESNRLARYLRHKGVGPDVAVGICCGREPEMVIGILGILKAGGGYVPLDPDYPSERLSYMLSDSGSQLVLTHSACTEVLQQLSTDYELIELDGPMATYRQCSAQEIDHRVGPSDLAYVIYTSGSTGRPKGVCIEHGTLLRSTQARIAYYNITPSIFQVPSFSFDSSVAVLFWALLTGGRVLLSKTEELKDADYIGRVLQQSDTLLCVPSYYRFVLSEGLLIGAGLKQVILAGESVEPALVADHYRASAGVKLYNEYGPTEGTVWSTVCELKAGEEVITIGRPVEGVSVYLLDDSGQPVPIGISGELYIGGLQLARGYLNQPELTKEKFIDHKGERLYRTGDRGHWEEEGLIVFEGRRDDQVKLRGYRIELSEIGRLLEEHEAVQQAVALVVEAEGGHKQLMGFVACGVKEGREVQEAEVATVSSEALRSWLLARLPEYMVPVRILTGEALPLTPNGKIDKQALLQWGILAGSVKQESYEGPRNETEAQLMAIWQELLGEEHIGIHDVFFELGGDSISSIQFISRARKLGYNMRPKDIFKYQTIARLSGFLLTHNNNNTEAEQSLLSGKAGLLPVQQWYFNNLDAFTIHYNQNILLGISKEITRDMLQEVVKQLILHHDALRFRYSWGENTWLQEYGDYGGEVVAEDISMLQGGEAEAAIQQLASRYQQSLDLEKGELVRVVLMQTATAEKHNRLLFIVHHLAIDGVSWRILLDDLEMLLTACAKGRPMSLGIKSSSYRQWHQQLVKYTPHQQAPYWRQVISNYFPLPVDEEVDLTIKANSNAFVSRALDKDKTSQLLKELLAVSRTEINDVLLAVLAMTVQQWTGQSTVVVGLEGHGREQLTDEIDTSRTVGWFTSLYPILLEIPSGSDGIDILRSVREQLQRIPDKGLGYGVLKYLSGDPLLQGKDPWDIEFNYLGQTDNVINKSRWFSPANESTGNFLQEQVGLGNKIAVTAIIEEGELRINWAYRSLVYRPETISQLSHRYIKVLELVMASCLAQKEKLLTYTAADYGLPAEITYQELDEFFRSNDPGKEDIMIF